MKASSNLILIPAVLVCAGAGAHAALTTGLAFSAFNIDGNPDGSGRMFTFVPGPAAVPDLNSAWATVSSVEGAYISDFGDDNVGFGTEAVWNRVDFTGTQSGPATNVELIYRGWFYDSDGMFAFAENIDDNVLVKVDGIDVISNRQDQQAAAWQTPTSSLSDLGATGSAGENQSFSLLTPSQQAGNFGVGWHSIEIRLGEFGGTGGPHVSALAGTGWSDTFGFGISGIGDSPLTTSIYDAATYSIFDAANFPLAPDGGPGLRYDSIDPTGGTNIIIPEPASMGLLLGGLGLLMRRRRA